MSVGEIIEEGTWTDLVGGVAHWGSERSDREGEEEDERSELKAEHAGDWEMRRRGWGGGGDGIYKGGKLKIQKRVRASEGL